MVRRTTGRDRAAGGTLSAAQTRLLDEATTEIARWSGTLGEPVTVDWRDELSLRGRLLGIRPAARVSAGGTCRILRAADGWMALTVARPWDHEVLPALLEGPVDGDHWRLLAHWVGERPAADAVDRARLLDMAAAVLGGIPPTTPVPLGTSRLWPPSAPPPLDRLKIVDLSALWAGPLAAQLLQRAGATVIKVEATDRPDGARAIPVFYRHFHPADQPHVLVDLTSEGGRTELRELVDSADVVIEASRPRAFRQLGIGPSDAGPRPGRVWLSITGYGRCGPGADWIAFGDDAAVAGGLVGRSRDGDPRFASDAIADPLTGLFGAAAVLRSLAAGGGHLIDLALAGAAAAVARGERTPSGPPRG
jgi:hypothetical protein